MESEVVVGKRGRITIPAELRQKFGIQGRTELKVVGTKEGVLFKIKSEKDAKERVSKKLDNPPDLGTVNGKLSRSEIYQDDC
jgi:AbrB family looped-hinge helix DNA binding protein